MKAQIAAYAKSTDEADLVLPSALSSDERKQLHEYIDRFELQHSSIGAGTDRRLVVSRFRPFAAVSPAQAEVIIGSQVWKDPPAQAAGEGTRGHIISYDRSEARWLLQYPNSDEPDEHVDIGTLNVRLRRRAVHDHGPTGIGGAGLPSAGGGTDAEALLTELEGGIREDWGWNMPKYDARHWMDNLSKIMGAEKGTPAYKLFMSMVSDALYWLLPGETERVQTHCERLGMSGAQIKKLRRKYWRRRCRYSCPQPRLMLRSLVDIYLFFRDQPDPLKVSITVARATLHISPYLAVSRRISPYLAASRISRRTSPCLPAPRADSPTTRCSSATTAICS